MNWLIQALSRKIAVILAALAIIAAIVLVAAIVSFLAGVAVAAFGWSPLFAHQAVLIGLAALALAAFAVIVS
jgi:hypothetical protein